MIGLAGPLFSLVALCFLGAVFGLAASIVALRYGRSRVVPFWLGTAVVLGSIGATRALAAQRVAGVDPERVSVSGTYALLIISTVVILSMPTLAVWRHAPRTQSIAYVRRGFLAAGWTLLGLAIAVGIAIVLDLANVPFIPVR